MTVVISDLCPNKDWTERMSVPCSRRWVANECLSVWIVARFMMPARFFAALITKPIELSVMGLPGIAPGKSQEVDLEVSRYWVSVPRAIFERMV